MKENIFFTVSKSHDGFGPINEIIIKVGGNLGNCFDIHNNLGCQPFNTGDTIVKWSYNGNLDLNNDDFPDWFREMTWNFDHLINEYPLWYKEIDNSNNDELISEDFKKLIAMYRSEDRKTLFDQNYRSLYGYCF
jgi:hypothetical protein